MILTKLDDPQNAFWMRKKIMKEGQVDAKRHCRLYSHTQFVRHLAKKKFSHFRPLISATISKLT